MTPELVAPADVVEVFRREAAADPSALEPAALASALSAVVDTVAARWPGVAIDPAVLVAGVAAHWHPHDDPPRSFEPPRYIADLGLAIACLRGEPAALRYLDELFGRAAGTLRRLKLGPHDSEDVLQETRIGLLIGDHPKLAQYHGEGPLEQWLAIVCGRAGLMLLRRRRVTEPVDDAALDDAALDPEAAVHYARHGAVWKRAVQAAVAELPPRDRAMLRALVIDQRSVNEIATLWTIHRVTASRWVSRVRREVLAATRKKLQDELSLDDSELDSAVRLVSAQLELSLERILAG